MAMLAGSEAPRMVSLQRGNSTSIHNCERLLDVRTYPAHWVDNTFVVPYHVGMGLKWYLISPEGRKALLKMRIPNRSFERCVWRRLFDTFHAGETSSFGIKIVSRPGCTTAARRRRRRMLTVSP